MTSKKGRRIAMALVFVNVAVMKNVPAGPFAVGMALNEVISVGSDIRGLTISGGMAPNSLAPMSQSSTPLSSPSTGRDKPR